MRRRRSAALRVASAIRDCTGVPHLKRECGSKHVPLHVTAKVADDLPSLRTRACFRVIEKAFRAGLERPGRREDGEFR